jgi:hypothetical protein
MFIIFTLVSLLSVILLCWIPLALIKMDKFELFILFLFTSFINQHINFKIFSSYERLHVKAEHIPRIISYLHFGIISPILLICILYGFRSRISIINKVFLFFSWICFDLISKKIYLSTNILVSETQSWYPIVDVAIAFTIMLISFIFMVKIRAILKSEMAIIE